MAKQGKPIGSMVISLDLAYNKASYTKSLAATQRATKAAMTEMRAQMSVIGNTGTEMDKLATKYDSIQKVMKAQEQELKILHEKYEQAKQSYGENSKEATNMANKINTVVAKHQAMQKSLDATKSSMDHLKSSQKELSDDMALSKRESQSLATSYRAQGRESDALKVEYQALSKEIQDRGRMIQNERQKLNALISEKGKDARETREQVIAVRDLETANREAITAQKSLGKETKKSGDQTSLAGKGMNLFKGILAAGFVVAGIRAVANGVKEVVTQTSEASREMNKFKGVLGVTDKEAGKLNKTGRSIYKSGFGESMEQTNEAVRETKSLFSNLGNKELKQTSKSALNLANTFDADVNEVLRGGRNMAVNFGLEGKKSFDLMAYGAQHGLDFSKEFFDNISEYSVQFKNAGFSADEMMNILIAGSKNGVMNLDKVNDTVKEFGVRIGDGSNTTAQGMSKMSKSTQGLWKQFLKGKATSSQVFTAVTKDLGTMKNANDRNNAGVALMGTQWEDVGPKAIFAMGQASTGTVNAKGSMDKLNKSVQNKQPWEVLKRNSLAAVNAIGQKVAPIAGKIGSDMQAAFSKIDKIKQAIKAMFQGDWAQGASILHNVLPDNVIQNIIRGVTDIKKWFNSLKPTFREIGAAIKPIIDGIVVFIQSIGKQLSDFWKENGTMIMAAIRNVIVIVKPVLLLLISIISGIIDNIKGIIQGALNIIMGVIKIFAGLFTGNWKKMWEGVKQLFSGAIQFVWNLIQIAFVGRILKAGRALITGFRGLIKALWAGVKGLFSSGVSGSLSFVTNLLKKTLGIGTKLKTGFVNTMKGLWTGTKKMFSNMVDYVKNMPGKMADGVRKAGSSLKKAFADIWNGVLKAVGKPVNAVINGVNWVLDKFGSKKKVTKWKVPQYKRGTEGHPGGLAMVNDQSGANYKELVTLPNGASFVPKARNAILPLPARTQVTPAKDTRQMARVGMIPHYKKGIGAKIWDTTKSVASKAKNMAFDVFDYATHPSKLMGKMMEKFVHFDGMSHVALDLGKSMVGSVKGAVTSLFKKEGENSGGAAPKGTGVTRWASLVKRSLAMNSLPTSGNYVNAWLRQIKSESGGNEKAVQHGYTDVNTISGDLAKGLLQTISGTFNAYKFPGHGNILNGFDNMLAAMNYAKNRYGAKEMLQVIGHGHGYENGGIVQHETFRMAEKNRPEMIIPLHASRRSRAQYLIQKAMQIVGYESKPLGSATPKTSDDAGLQTMIGQLAQSNQQQAEMITLLKALLDKQLIVDEKALERSNTDLLSNKLIAALYNKGGV
ncbi:hypothetical protein HCJ66_11445 [Listeria sp. FSL L7-1582]|uniref:phage tail tape measure protein n=1 Tax=Listeria portnoyi TaxID=2713504 RepID=UPI00164E156E|nr:phage tail tape measure protein [Listeria portnoyi]MBC6310152.1 hypothetical protein [Listeria portnoyi]